MNIIDFKSKNSIFKKRNSKFNNKRVEYIGWKFDSQLECNFFKHLQTLKNACKIDLILRQVPFHLAPGSKYVCDFMVRYAGDPALYFFDTKGFMTENSRTKIKLVSHIYGIDIKIIKKEDFY